MRFVTLSVIVMIATVHLLQKERFLKLQSATLAASFVARRPPPW